MSRRLPWMKFNPNAWRSDKELCPCSYAARGLWIEIIALCHEGEPYGHLVINGKPPSLKVLAANTRGTEKETGKLLQELEEAGVFSRTPEGVIYCRRMVADKASEDAAREHGKRGGNPNLRSLGKGGVNPPVNEGVGCADNDTPKLEERGKKEEEYTPLPPVPGGEMDLFGGKPAQPRPRARPSPDTSADDEPLFEVLRAWNQEACEKASQVRDLSDDLRRRRVAELLQRAGSIENVRRLFAFIAKCERLNGSATSFVAWMDWAIKPEKVTQLSEEAGLEFGPAKQRRRAGR